MRRFFLFEPHSRRLMSANDQNYLEYIVLRQTLFGFAYGELPAVFAQNSETVDHAPKTEQYVRKAIFPRGWILFHEIIEPHCRKWRIELFDICTRNDDLLLLLTQMPLKFDSSTRFELFEAKTDEVIETNMDYERLLDVILGCLFE